jgi:hypothetical protein
LLWKATSPQLSHYGGYLDGESKVLPTVDEGTRAELDAATLYYSSYTRFILVGGNASEIVMRRRTGVTGERSWLAGEV